MNNPISLLLRQNKHTLRLVAVVGIFVLGLLDYITGYELSFALFYLVPISFAGWYIDKNSALVFAVLSVVTWHMANRFAGQTFSHPLIPYWNDGIRLGFFVTTTLLVVKLKKTLIRERSLAQHDFLTGVHNSRSFFERVQELLALPIGAYRPLSIVYLDLDNFKALNDQRGHNAGDRVLVTMADILQKSVSETDMVARMGGDEFIVLLPDTGARDARAIVDRIRLQFLLEMAHKECPVTFSGALVTCEFRPDSVGHLLQIVDDVMYWAKEDGKDRVRSFTFTSVHSQNVMSQLATSSSKSKITGGQLN